MHRLLTVEIPQDAIDSESLERRLDKLGVEFSRKDDDGFMFYRLCFDSKKTETVDELIFNGMCSSKPFVYEVHIPAKDLLKLRHYLNQEGLNHDFYLSKGYAHVTVMSTEHDNYQVDEFLDTIGLEKVANR